MKKIKFLVLSCLLLFPLILHASFIESTMGAAVVNDATATYYNPAALTLLKKPEIIILNTVGDVRNKFTGQSIQSRTNFAQTGSSITETNYYLPSFYLGVPLKNNFTFGFAVIANSFNKDVDGNSILRYEQSNNSAQNIDFVPAVGYKFNDIFSLGAGLDLSYADFLFKPTTGFPSLNIPDSESRNECDATGVGWDVGALLKPSKSTIIGLNYRSAVTYKFSGTSIFESNPEIVSDNYGFTFWTPARIVLSASQAITPSLRVIGTAQRIEWSIFDTVHIHGIATPIGILNADVPYHLHDTWLLTLGGQYNLTPKWIVRAAGSYNQSPANGNFQISNGDSIILGASTGYEIFKNIIVDGSYAHAFIRNKNINVMNNNNINGVTNGFVNVVSLKLTFKLA